MHSDLLRRLNPKHTQRNLDYIIRLAPDLTEDLLSSVDQPLVVKRCKQSGREYLLCDYNRDGDSYRSPWSNQFDPPLDESGPGGVDAGGNDGAGEGAVPGERVRKMEVKANEAFDIYRELYYEGGVSSVYLWNLDDGFAGVVLLKKCEWPFLLERCQFAATGTSEREHTRCFSVSLSTYTSQLTHSVSSSLAFRWQQLRRMGLDSRVRGERARTHDQLSDDFYSDVVVGRSRGISSLDSGRDGP